MFVSNFPQIIKSLLKKLPKNDYPVLNTFLFASCWIGFGMDKSLVSMRDLLTRVTTFSKASKTRDIEIFKEILNQGIEKLKKKNRIPKNKIYFPLDSTIITLTSKLLWQKGYHQVKLFAGCNNWDSSVGGIVIHLGQGHDSKYGEETIKNIPENGIGIMDRGFCSKKRIRNLLESKSKFFVLCDRENKNEYRLATNLTEVEFSNEEVGEIYRKRWAIETLWKFLKMHLKLDNLITKNENGIQIQIYSCLIGYIILQLIEIPKEIGDKALDKLRYLQSFMNENISYIHWFRRMSFSW